MLSKTLLALAGMLAAAQAIMVTSPTKDEKLDFSKTIEIKWSSVSSDPTTFDLVLVDQSNVNSPISVGSNVKTSDGSYSLTNFVATAGAKYKFNLLSVDPKNTGILAQSETFEISKSGSTETSSSSSSTSSSSSATSTDAAATTTGDSTSSGLTTKTTAGTASKTGSSSASNTANASSTGAAPVTSGNAAVALGAKTVGVAGSIFAGLLMLL